VLGIEAQPGLTNSLISSAVSFYVTIISLLLQALHLNSASSGLQQNV
jgi:hypothetical protein